MRSETDDFLQHDDETSYCYANIEDDNILIASVDFCVANYALLTKQQTAEFARQLLDMCGHGWISVDDQPVLGSYNWEIGDKAIGWNGYAFEIEWDGDDWCNIGGDDFTHWMRSPEPPCSN